MAFHRSNTFHHFVENLSLAHRLHLRDFLCFASFAACRARTDLPFESEHKFAVSKLIWLQLLSFGLQKCLSTSLPARPRPVPLRSSPGSHSAAVISSPSFFHRPCIASGTDWQVRPAHRLT